MNWKIALLDENANAVEVFNVPQDRPLVIGRGTASDTRITDPLLSRIHCKVLFDKGRLVVEDAESASGTYVRGKSVKRHYLDIDDQIVIGNTRLRVQNDSPLDSKTVVAGTRQPLASQASPSGTQLHELAGENINRFKLQTLVASGKSSVVYKAIDTADNKPVALKILHPQYTLDEKQQERFIRAMRTMLPVRHPHIVRLYRAGKQKKLCWVAMEWVSGTSLRDIIDLIGIRGTLEWKDVWRIAIHVTRALVEAEKQKIVHRNVTPSNILRRDQDKSYLLTDLIFAKALDETEAIQLTRPGDVLGEIAYLAPERITDPFALTSSSDRYSLGVTLYLLATGQLPFASSSISVWLDQIENHVPKPPAQMCMGFDERFSDLIVRLLSKQPEQRFHSSIELLIDLERVGKFGGLEADWSEWV